MLVQNSKLKVQSCGLKLKIIFKIINFAFCIAIFHFTLFTPVLSLPNGLHLPKAHAETVSLKIQPATLQIHSTSPADIRAPFALTNQTDSTIELSLILKRFEPSEDENGEIVFSKPDLSNDKDKDAFLQKVQIVDNGFAVDSLTLSPKQEKKLQISLSLDKNSPPQDHYFAVVFIAKATENDMQNSENTISQVQIAISLPVLLSVGKNKDNALFIEEFSAPIFLQSGPVPFNLKVKNAGTHFVSPKALILIKNIFGQTVGRVEVPKTNILSGSSRYLTNSNSKSFAYSPELSTQKFFWEEKFLLGFYTANLSIVNENNELLYTRTTHFVAFPFIFLIGFLVGVFFLTIIIRRIKKKLS